jgi:hypothetical protein
MKAQAIKHIVQAEVAGAAFRLTTKNAIADSGATQIFVTEGKTAVKKRATTRPLKVSLADRRQVISTHMCHIKTDGLPLVLTGHITPDLSIALLFGIRAIREAGCKVIVLLHSMAVSFAITTRLFYEVKMIPSWIY